MDAAVAPIMTVILSLGPEKAYYSSWWDPCDHITEAIKWLFQQCYFIPDVLSIKFPGSSNVRVTFDSITPPLFSATHR